MKTKQQRIEELEQRADKIAQEVEALDYAIYLVSKKQREAVSMVRDCPENIYICEWKKEAQRLTEKLGHLNTIREELGEELSALCSLLENAENEQ